MSAFNRLKTSLYDDGFPIKYLNVKEFTRKGKEHLHMLIEGWIPYLQLSERWERATGGLSKMAFARQIHDRKGALAYITKYITKAIQSGKFKKGERRYSSSRGVLEPVKHESTGTWEADISRGGLEWTLPPQAPTDKRGHPLRMEHKGPPLSELVARWDGPKWYQDARKRIAGYASDIRWHNELMALPSLDMPETKKREKNNCIERRIYNEGG